MGFTPEQIKGRIKSVAKQNNADARTLMRIYMMERFLERLAQSEYRDNFIIKGGILVTAMIGVAHRSTMDIAITPCTAEHPMSFKVPDRLLTDGQCRMMINGIQFIQALLEANELAVGKDHQFKGRYEAEKNAVIISLEKDEREW